MTKKWIASLFAKSQCIKIQQHEMPLQQGPAMPQAEE